MQEAEKELPEDRGWKKWFKRDNLIVLILSGVLLFIIALPTKEAEAVRKEETDSVTKKSGISAVQEGMNRMETEVNSTQTDYAAYLEDKLQRALSDVSNVGRVEVMITLQSSEELVVEKDVPVNRSNTNETDSEGGTRIISQMESKETTIYRTEGSNSEPYVVKTILPKVEGVLVVAQGAGNGTVDKSITEIVQALFGLEAHKVKVVKMEVNENLK